MSARPGITVVTARSYTTSKLVVFWVLLVITSVTVSEAALRVLSLAVPEHLGSTTVPVTVADSQLGARGNPGYAGHDARGFRNSATLQQAAVVALGDSQTYGVGVLPEQAWPAQLARMTGLATYSMALGSYGPTQALLLLDEALALRPKVVIEAFYWGNDLYDTYSQVYHQGQVTELRSRDSAVVEHLAEAERNGPIALKAQLLFDRALLWRERPPPPPPEGLAGQLQLVRLAAELRGRWDEWRGRAPLDSRQFDEPFWAAVTREAQGDAEDRWIFQRGRLRTVFTPAYRLCAVDLSDPRLQEGLRISLDAMTRMHERVIVAGVRFLVLLIPTKERVFLAAVKESGQVVPAAYTELMENEEAVWQSTETSLRTGGIAFLDLRPVLEEVVYRGGQPYKTSWDGHPNEVGHRAIAEAVALKLADLEVK